jgi:hypothetical protein
LINSDATTTIALMKLMMINGDYYLRGVMLDDNGVHRETDAWLVSDGPHYAEIRALGIGAAKMPPMTDRWCSQENHDSVDMYERFNDSKTVAVGSTDCGNGWRYFLDEIVNMMELKLDGPLPMHPNCPVISTNEKAANLVPVQVALWWSGLTPCRLSLALER